MHCCIPTPVTDNNTSTGVIFVTLNVGRSAVNRQGISHCLESGHPVQHAAAQLLNINRLTTLHLLHRFML